MFTHFLFYEAWWGPPQVPRGSFRCTAKCIPWPHIPNEQFFVMGWLFLEAGVVVFEGGLKRCLGIELGLVSGVCMCLLLTR